MHVRPAAFASASPPLLLVGRHRLGHALDGLSDGRVGQSCLPHLEDDHTDEDGNKKRE